MSAETPNQHPLEASEFDAQFVLQPDGTTAMLHLCANCPGWPANVLLRGALQCWHGRVTEPKLRGSSSGSELLK